MSTIVCLAALCAAFSPVLGRPLEDVGFRWETRPPDTAGVGQLLTGYVEVTNYGQQPASYWLCFSLSSGGGSRVWNTRPPGVDTPRFVTNMPGEDLYWRIFRSPPDTNPSNDTVTHVTYLRTVGCAEPVKAGPRERIRYPSMVRSGPIRLRDLPEDADVSIHDISGSAVENDRRLAPGTYFVRVRSAGETVTLRVVVAR